MVKRRSKIQRGEKRKNEEESVVEKNRCGLMRIEKSIIVR